MKIKIFSELTIEAPDVIPVSLLIVPPPPPKINGGGGVLVFGIWTKRRGHKKLLRNRGLVERGNSFKMGRFPNCFFSFP